MGGVNPFDPTVKVTDETGVFGVGVGPGVAPGTKTLVSVHCDPGVNWTWNVALVPVGSFGGFSLTVRTGLVVTAGEVTAGWLLRPLVSPVTVLVAAEAFGDPLGFAETTGPCPANGDPPKARTAAAARTRIPKNPPNQSQKGATRRRRRGLPCSSKSGQPDLRSGPRRTRPARGAVPRVAVPAETAPSAARRRSPTRLSYGDVAAETLVPINS